MYKVNHKRLSSERRVTTTTGMMSKTDQLQMFGDRAWYAKQVPGFYKPDYNSVDKKSKTCLYFPRTKEAGSGPGTKRLEKDKSLAPGQYNINYHTQDKKEFSGAFTKSKNVNFLERAQMAKKHVPGVGRYKETDKGYRAISRPVSSCITSRRRMG